jgi:NAD(P)-dependent dehydrogenase (short-subunit alcohol dehydrogenase family)
MVTIVTGATRGIGLAITKVLLELGMPVAAIGVNPKNLERLNTDLGVPVYQCNVGEHAEVKQKVGEIVKA